MKKIYHFLIIKRKPLGNAVIYILFIFIHQELCVISRNILNRKNINEIFRKGKQECQFPEMGSFTAFAYLHSPYEFILYITPSPHNTSLSSMEIY